MSRDGNAEPSLAQDESFLFSIPETRRKQVLDGTIFALSHPFARKNAKGWGTGLLFSVP
jgi:hypothetical protein